MANGSFKLGKQSGGTLGLVFPDGVSDTEVVLPESGELATKEYVDSRDVVDKGYVDSRDVQNVKLTENQTISDIKTFLKSPIAPTPANGDNSTKLATTAFVLANGANTSNVATATAALSAGSIGSYVFATAGENAPARTLGSTWAGSGLKAIQPLPPSNLNYSGSFSGTWRFLGGASIPAGLYLRIA